MTGMSWEDDGAQESLLTRRSAQNCLTEQEIEAFLFNRLSGVTREVVEEHLLVCDDCLDAVESEEEFVKAAGAAAQQLESETLLRSYNGESQAAGEPSPGVLERLQALLASNWGRPLSLAAVGMSALALLVVVLPRYTGVAPEATVTLQAERGDTRVLDRAAPSGARLVLTADLTGLPELPRYRVEMVDAEGELLISAELVPQAGKVVWRLDRASVAGHYWLRVSDPASPQLILREFGLAVR